MWIGIQIQRKKQHHLAFYETQNTFKEPHFITPISTFSELCFLATIYSGDLLRLRFIHLSGGTESRIWEIKKQYFLIHFSIGKMESSGLCPRFDSHRT